MAYSMTGFGRGESSNGERRFIVEIRTVNHRYCDIAVRMPRTFSGLEDRLRQAVTQKIRRGKIDVYVGAEEFGGREREIVVDIGLARAYINAANELKANFTLRDDMSLSTLLRMPDIFRIDDVSPEEDEIWELMGSAAQSALDALLSMRAREGAKLIADVKSRIDLLASLLTHIEKRAPLIVDDYRERLNSRLKELLGQNIPDENRIATEIAIFADKCGIDEEITRFRSHLAQAGRCCDSIEPVGRKFDFILQEINREVNTIGSKSSDLAISEKVVEMKSEAEKIREQIQNIE